MGIYFIASTNPSSWAFTGVFAFAAGLWSATQSYYWWRRYPRSVPLPALSCRVPHAATPHSSCSSSPSPSRSRCVMSRTLGLRPRLPMLPPTTGIIVMLDERREHPPGDGAGRASLTADLLGDNILPPQYCRFHGHSGTDGWTNYDASTVGLIAGAVLSPRAPGRGAS